MFECVARLALFALSSECKSSILKSICNRFQPSERELQGVHDGQENEGHRH